MLRKAPPSLRRSFAAITASALVAIAAGCHSAPHMVFDNATDTRLFVAALLPGRPGLVKSVSSDRARIRFVDSGSVATFGRNESVEIERREPWSRGVRFAVGPSSEDEHFLIHVVYPPYSVRMSGARPAVTVVQIDHDGSSLGTEWVSVVDVRK